MVAPNVNDNIPDNDPKKQLIKQIKRSSFEPIRREKIEDSGFMVQVLDWVLAEQQAGRSPCSLAVAAHFDLSIPEAEQLHKNLTKMGEFD